MGIRQSDPRLENMVGWLEKLSVNGNIDMLRLDLQTFRMIMNESIVLITAALHKKMVIPAFDTLCYQISAIYQQCKVKFTKVQHKLFRSWFNLFHEKCSRFYATSSRTFHCPKAIVQIVPDCGRWLYQIIFWQENNVGTVDSTRPFGGHQGNPNHFGISVCTIDGQRFSIGDTSVPFCLQSIRQVLSSTLCQLLLSVMINCPNSSCGLFYVIAI